MLRCSARPMHARCKRTLGENSTEQRRVAERAPDRPSRAPGQDRVLSTALPSTRALDRLSSRESSRSPKIVSTDASDEQNQRSGVSRAIKASARAPALRAQTRPPLGSLAECGSAGSRRYHASSWTLVQNRAARNRKPAQRHAWVPARSPVARRVPRARAPSQGRPSSTPRAEPKRAQPGRKGRRNRRGNTRRVASSGRCVFISYSKTHHFFCSKKVQLARQKERPRTQGKGRQWRRKTTKKAKRLPQNERNVCTLFVLKIACASGNGL